MTSLGKRIQSSSLKQREIAARLGCSESTVSRYARGLTPTGAHKVGLEKILSEETKDLRGADPVHALIREGEGVAA